MSDIFEITKQFTFEAAHYFPNMPKGHIYRKIHGHSFMVEVTFHGKKNRYNQWVTDFDNISASLEKIKKKLDHKCINDIKEIGLPTLENISSSESLTVDLDLGESEINVVEGLRDKGYKVKRLEKHSNWITLLISSE